MMVTTDPKSDKFREKLDTILSSYKQQARLRAEVVFYIAKVFEDFTPEQIKDMCMAKSLRGAKEHGPAILTDPIQTKKEKLDELLDLIVYTVIEEEQEIK